MDIADMKFVYKTHEKKHKGKPAQFVSVAGGVQKRLETNIKYRKSCRISVFDHGRNLSREPSPVPVPQDDFKTKQEHRRQQLEKWKEEKEKRKKEEAAHKKKPFVASVAHAPLKYVPPPPPKVMPSTSGRVTRSQAAKNQQKSKAEAKTAQQSFAPKNAGFRPPQLKVDLVPDIQYLALPTFNKQSKATINNKKSKNLPTFDPKPTNTVKSSRSKTNLNSRQTDKENTVRMNTRSKPETTQNTTKAKPTKSSSKKLKKTPKKTIQSSTESSTDMDSQEYVSENSLDKQPRNETIQSPILKSETPRKSILQASNVTPRNSVPKSESSSEEKLRSPKDTLTMTPEAIAEEAKHISPCVTISRGKDNARRESQRKLKEGLLADGRSDMENVQHFRRQLDAEVARITRLCHIWDEIYEQCELPEFVQEMVLGGVGQARLLMASKLQQFAGLVDRCEARDSCAGLVTPADLQGFWDMVFIQIENVDLRFKALDNLRARGWAPEERPAAASAARRRPARPQGPQAKAVKPKGNSRIKDMIAAARKAKKEQESASSDTSSSPKPDSVAEGEGEKTFEAGFFCIRSPVRSPAAPATPVNSRHNLLKSVLSSEARKASASKNHTSYAMLRASLISKSEEIEGIAPLVQTPKLSSINLNATPARSILKSGKATSVRKSGKKSIKTVLFNQSDSEINDSVLVPVKLIPETNIDSGLSMDVDKEVENADKENKKTRRRSKLVRQEAIDDSPVMTRSRRKSMQTPKEERHERPKRAGRQKKMLQESESNVVEDKSEATPNKSSRRKKSAPEEEVVAKATPKRSSRRNKMIGDLIDLATPEPRTRGGPWRLTTG